MQRGRRLKPYLVPGFLLFLAGCGFLPLPVTVASVILDGISLAATEKTVADHGLSMVAGRDCALWRGMTGGEFCRDELDNDVLLAANDENTEDLDDDGFDEDLLWAAAPDDDDEETDGSGLGEETAIAALPDAAPITVAEIPPPPAPSPGPAPARTTASGFHYVLASFTNQGNAKRMVRRNAKIKSRAVTATVSGKTVYRIVVGPFAAFERKAARESLAAAGYTDAWGLKLRKNNEQNVLLAAVR